MIKYLIKFVSKQTYAEQLVNGTLFMRPASYYHNLELGRGDPSEANIFDGVCIYKNSNVPIYCMYSVDEDDIIDNKIIIPHKVISDFECENGFCVLINYNEFEEKLQGNFVGNQYTICGGLVQYGRKPKEFSTRIMIENTVEHLFIKPSFFSYQKEYRIVVQKQVYRYDEKPIDSVNYSFPTDIRSFSKIFDVSKLAHNNNGYIIELKTEVNKDA